MLKASTGSRLVAKGQWLKMVNHSPCTQSSPGGYPALPSGCWPDNPERRITKKAVVAGLIIVGCGSGLVAATVTGPGAAVVWTTIGTLSLCSASALSAGGS